MSVFQSTFQRMKVKVGASLAEATGQTSSGKTGPHVHVVTDEVNQQVVTALGTRDDAATPIAAGNSTAMGLWAHIRESIKALRDLGTGSGTGIRMTIISSALPTGAATGAKQDAAAALLTNIHDRTRDPNVGVATGAAVAILAVAPGERRLVGGGSQLLRRLRSFAVLVEQQATDANNRRHAVDIIVSPNINGAPLDSGTQNGVVAPTVGGWTTTQNRRIATLPIRTYSQNVYIYVHNRDTVAHDYNVYLVSHEQ